MNAPILHLVGTIVIDDHSEVPELWVLGGRVSFTRPAATTDVVRLEGVFVPGLVDVHCHVGLDTNGAVSQDVARAQAVADRDSGVLLIRDAGSPADTSWVAQDLTLPRLIRCGRHVARPKRYLRNYGQEIAHPDALAEVLVDNLEHRADGWNKIVADWIDRDFGDLAPLWTSEQLRLALKAVHERGGRVTAHSFSTEAIDGLLDAGIDCIEHGTGMTEQQIQRAKSLGVPVTPTLLQIAQFEKIAAQGQGKYPDYARRMRLMYARRYDQARLFWESGMQILVGTDAGGTIEHGRIANECAELTMAGIPAREVVASAAWRARKFLGIAGIEEGECADIVGYTSDPRADITQLMRPKHVILRGAQVI